MILRIPQPIPYQGSKRAIAPQILRVFPPQISSLIEPFAGSAAVSVAAAYHQKADRFYLNDLNKPLMDLLKKIIDQPQQIADEYEQLWHEQLGQERAFYDFIRDQFNRTHRPDYFLYLLARCVKASVRYNSDGHFNQSPDNRRKGRRPKGMRQEIMNVSQLLQGKTAVTNDDYTTILNRVTPSDLVYLDPPYQGTSQARDTRYYQGLDVTELTDFLAELNSRQILFILSYDGRTGKKSYGVALPTYLKLHKLEIYAGRSTQATLLGKKASTYESLYLSPSLVEQLHVAHKEIDSLWVSSQPRRRAIPIQLELGLV